MENVELLQAVVAMILWTMVMWGWMYATRIPAMNAAGVDIATVTGGKPTDTDELLPEKIQWKAHNYNHLLTEPTLFYAICIVATLTGGTGSINVAIAWIYVGLRVVHSIVQATSNRILHRFSLFALSSICIIILTIRTAISIF